MSTYRLDVPELYARLDDMRRQAGMSWRGLAAHLDVSASTFSRMQAGHRPDADALVTFLEWLDLDVVYVTQPDGSPR
ncbi:helix-turn-helix transcriptional regulator [Streptomyces sp. H27-G5]|uniref:helix-turn-helix domain-containing protein n=1 Tax=Streptomyces sp. H27-G5 TaxID=2996698 RepID=UPI00226FD4A0|nr:helix-turn-helix transcriptional regulator [Streptomyces sp. H27-G5]MCY0917000.1 helix-turn-helix transcriptional regulator [Streptomyces sp. H27-G5]